MSSFDFHSKIWLQIWWHFNPIVPFSPWPLAIKKFLYMKNFLLIKFYDVGDHICDLRVNHITQSSLSCLFLSFPDYGFCQYKLHGKQHQTNNSTRSYKQSEYVIHKGLLEHYYNNRTNRTMDTIKAAMWQHQQRWSPILLGLFLK